MDNKLLLVGPCILIYIEQFHIWRIGVHEKKLGEDIFFLISISVLDKKANTWLWIDMPLHPIRKLIMVIFPIRFKLELAIFFATCCYFYYPANSPCKITLSIGNT